MPQNKNSCGILSACGGVRYGGWSVGTTREYGTKGSVEYDGGEGSMVQRREKQYGTEKGGAVRYEVRHFGTERLEWRLGA